MAAVNFSVNRRSGYGAADCKPGGTASPPLGSTVSPLIVRASRVIRGRVVNRISRMWRDDRKITTNESGLHLVSA